jgi:hypothetical protein
VPLNRQHLADIYRPVGPKIVTTGIPWTSSGSAAITQAIDLSLPIRGLRLIFKGRVVVGTAAFTTVTPEGLLNLISNIVIQGTNARQQGNLTLWNIDLATAFVFQNLFGYRGAAYMTTSVTGAGGDTINPIPSTPFPSGAVGNNPFFQGSIATTDFRIVIDFPFHPHSNNSFGAEPLTIPQYIVRNEEWKDSVQLLLTFGAQAGGGAIGVLGTSAATTAITFSGFNGSGTTPTIDLYSLPVLMGLNLKDQILPGVFSRVSTPLTSSLLTGAGSNVALLNMQKQPTPRVLFKQGAGTVFPAFTALTDYNVTTLGILLGGNRNVRNKVDIFAHKMLQPDIYKRDPIQGYNLFDFIEQGNPDASYPGQDVGDGATFQLIGDVAGLANAFGLAVQEQILHQPSGALMDF